MIYSQRMTESGCDRQVQLVLRALRTQFYNEAFNPTIIQTYMIENASPGDASDMNATTSDDRAGSLITATLLYSISILV